MRVNTRVEIQENTDGDPNTALETISHTETEFLFDHLNFTRYEQAVVETVWTIDNNGDRVQAEQISVYTLGRDVLSQSIINPATGGSGEGQLLVYDGRGSTRILADATGNVVVDSSHPQVFHYTAYGEFVPNSTGFSKNDALTSLLYKGEYFDTLLQQQYLRRRTYDPGTGRFNRLDDFVGDTFNPQTLNKYAYTSGDPIRYADPSGLTGTLGGQMASMGASSNVQAQNGAGQASAYVTAQTALKAISAISTGAEAIMLAVKMKNGDWTALAQEFIDIDFEFADKFKEKLKDKGLDKVEDFIADRLGGAVGGAIPRQYIGIGLPDNDDDDDNNNGGSRRRRMRVPKGKLGFMMRQVGKFAGAVAIKTNWAQEQVGELMTQVVTNLIGFEKVGLPWKRSNNGPDILAIHSSLGIWGMFEAKGGTSTLSKGASYGDQMNWDWINHWYKTIGDQNDGDGGLGEQLHDDYNAGEPLLAMVLSLNLQRPKTATETKPKHLRVGFQVWVAGETTGKGYWENWNDPGYDYHF